MKAPRLDPMQIEAIVNKLVPLVANPEDYDFFRGVLFVKFENCSSGEAALIVNHMLKAAA